MKWEYALDLVPVIEYPHDASTTEKQLNVAGADGWELVCAVGYRSAEGNPMTAYHFKRPLPQEPGT